uniref:Motile sperm domain-containing protein 1 n=1 Tax=Aceria tosichella TaxID=561515 RepID=A0A6G1SFV8_9ACAR
MGSSSRVFTDGEQPKIDLPIFVSPTELVFSMNKRRTLLTVYNPYGNEAQFRILTTNPERFDISSTRGTIKPNKRIDITIRLLSYKVEELPEPTDELQIIDQFRVSIQIGTLRGSRPVKVGWINYVTSEPDADDASRVMETGGQDMTPGVRLKSLKQSPAFISVSSSQRNSQSPTATLPRASTILIASSHQPAQSVNDFGMQQCINYETALSSFQDLYQSDSEQEPDDMALMRLMSVLNNPALTLTPVDAVSSASVANASENRIVGVGSRSHDESRTIKMGPQQSYSISRSHTLHDSSQPRSANLIQQIASRNTQLRIPKSTVNLIATGSSAPPVNGAQQAFGEAHVNMNTSSNQTETDNRVALEWLSRFGDASAIKDVDNSVKLSWLPSKNVQKEELVSAEQVKNDSKQAGEQPEKTTQIISVQMLHQIAHQAGGEDCQDSNGSNAIKSPIFESECIPPVSQVNVQQLDKGARIQEVVYTVNTSEDLSSKLKKEPIRGSKHRLYLPRPQKAPPRKLKNLPTIHIEATQQKEVLVSERHLMLEKMVEIAETVGQRKHATIEPDDIFVNRSKRIMSRIDTVMERKKRKRFERICHRSSPKDAGNGDQSETSDEDSVVEENPDLVDFEVVPIQLPLEETLTNEKRNFLSKVGLISRKDRHKLSIEECEKRLKTMSVLALQETGEVSEDLRRFIDTIVQTGGTDVQLRTETTIKRNELPFIEGLNRNTSRIKMNYMSALGLDKRSKRTTLYKVTKSQEKTSLQTVSQPQQQHQQQNDLTKKQQGKIPVNHLAKLPQTVSQRVVKPDTQTVMDQTEVEANLIARVVQLSKSSCREMMQVPKDEYMRSLGLMAS